MKRLRLHIFTATAFVAALGLATAQNAAVATTTVSPSASPTPALAPAPVPLADVITQADAAEATLQQMRANFGPESDDSKGSEDLALVTQEISAQLAETTQLLKPGVPLETLQRPRGALGKIGRATRPLDPRPNEPRQPDRQANRAFARLADRPGRRRVETAQASDTPPEIRQRIDKSWPAITQTENTLQKRRASS